MFPPPPPKPPVWVLISDGGRKHRPGLEPSWTTQQVDEQLRRVWRTFAGDPRVLWGVVDAWLDERLRADR